MPASLQLLNNFNNGELGERLAARADLARYPNAGKTFFNAQLFREGGWSRRPGTIFMGETLNSARAKLLEHVKSSETATLLEITDRKLRFWKDFQPVSLDAPGTSVANGDFSGGLTSWTDESATGATVLTATTDIAIPFATGTTIGNMTAGSGIAASFDGNTDQNHDQSSAKGATNGWVGKTWGAGKTITGARVYASNDRGFVQTYNPTVNIIIEGSNNAFATSFVVLGSTSLTDYNAAIVEIFNIDQSTAYTSHRVKIEAPGVPSSTGTYCAEVVFYEYPSVGGDVAEFTGGTAGEIAALTQTITGCTVGRLYGIAFDVLGSIGTGIDITVSVGGGGAVIAGPTNCLTGSHVFSVTATTTSFDIDFTSTSQVPQQLSNVRLVSGQIELDTPWYDAVIDSIQTIQRGDIQFVVAHDVPMHEIRRYGAHSWQVQRSAFTDGPWREEPVGSITLTPSGLDVGSVITLTASESLFAQSHVGALFRLATATGQLSFEPWAALKTGLNNGDEVVYEGNVYAKVSGTTGGTIPPMHEAGTAYDARGTGGILWRYLHQGYGVVRIVGFTSSTEVDAVVVSRLPTGLGTGGTAYWREGAFSDYRNHPSVIGFYENRLILADQIDTPGTFFMSRVDDYLNFRIGDLDDDPIIGTIRRPKRNRGDVNRILSISGGTALMFLTTGGPAIARSSREDRRLTQATIQIKTQIAAPASRAPAIIAQTSTLFIAANMFQLYEVAYDIQQDGFGANDLTIVADHVPGETGFAELVVQELPWPVVWGRRNDGMLATLLYDIQQGIAGWARYELGGTYGTGAAKVESVAVMPGNANTGTTDRDVVYAAVARTIDGATYRSIEYFGPHLRTGADRALHVACDAAVVYNLDVATDTLTGLGHLEGESVSIYADGLVHRNLTVVGGSVTLDRDVTQAVVGFGFEHEYESLDFATGAASGTAIGHKKRVNRVVLVLKESVGGEYGDGVRMYPIKYPAPHTADFLAGGLFTGKVPLDHPGDWERDPRVMVRGSDPVPFDCLAVVAQVNVNA